VFAGANTERRERMSDDDRRPPRKTVPWWQIATLVVTVARFAVDLVRKG
jgi:hypothetical protein